MLTGPQLIADIDACSTPHGTVAFWWLGQHSFVAKFGDTVVYLDPYLTPAARRNTPPLLKPEEITHAGIVLGTHDHGDHIDRPSLPALLAASPQAPLVVPGLFRDELARNLALPGERLVGLDEGQTVELGGLRISAVAAAHESVDRDPTTGQCPYLGYVVQGHGVTVYHAGDTCIYPGMHAALARFDIDLALLPINGRDAERYARNCIGNMTYQEAADLAGCLRPHLTVPAHFDMFDGNTADPELFQAYLNIKYPDLPGCIPQHGVRTLLLPTETEDNHAPPLPREAFLKEVALRAERTGEWLLAEENIPDISLGRLRETARAYVERPGKRLRPAVLLFACAAVGGDEEQALPAAAAVELFHTWSLVHDDIIDNDDLRRGKPTAHRLASSLAVQQLGLGAADAAHYGQSAAILAGDIQMAWAMRMLLRCRDVGVTADVVLDLLARLADQLAPQLINGEMLDVEFSHTAPEKLSEKQVLHMEELKTGALLGYAASTGACIGTGRIYDECPEAQALNAFARSCGIAFQLQDDILGIVGDERQLGKPIGSDLREGKATVLVLHALRHANANQRELLHQVLGKRRATTKEIQDAVQLLVRIGSIDHTCALAHQYIRDAHADLAKLPASPARDLLEAWGAFLFDRSF